MSGRHRRHGWDSIRHTTTVTWRHYTSWWLPRNTALGLTLFTLFITI